MTAARATKRSKSAVAADKPHSHSVQIYLSENAETSEELESAKQDPFSFVVEQLNQLENIRSLETA